MSIFNSALSGLLVSQRSLATTSHNISNVHTEGYSRQRVEVVARQAQFKGYGYLGTGVETSAVTRISDQFLTTQMRTSTTSSSTANAFLSLASRVDNMLANGETGLSPSLQNFFAAIQDVNDLPSSVTARQVMISEANSLASRFQFLDSRLSDLSEEVAIKLGEDVRDINTIASSIAGINDQIVSASNSSSGQLPNDLLDQRDLLVLELSELVAVNTVEQSNGSLNVFIGKGQPLVVGDNASMLGVTETYSGHYEITLTDTYSSSIITSSISGGSLGGQLDFQSQMLDTTRNSLGRLAIGLADTFNDQHRLGASLDGDVNTAFFSVGVPDVLALAGAPNNVTSVITDPDALSDSDYSLTFNGGNSYTLLRISDSTTTAINTGGVSPYTTPAVDGFTMTITAGAAVGDQYIIRPTINGASDVSVLISDPRKLAIAGPLKGGEVTNSSGIPTNVGSATLSDVNVTSTTGIPLASNITLTFDATNNRFDISAPIGGTLAYNPATDNSGKQFTIAAAGGATFTISGFPEDGDAFLIENNVGADGDNRNGLFLSDLQSSQLLLNGSASYQDTYGQLVAGVGSTTRQTEISSVALNVLLEQTVEARESVSGVNLDEEAANMLKFQQSYSAAAQMITIADNLFQSLLGAFR
ncbi:MAG: flagellar hook-associated protein FlgK [Proteobacteria bacterium]|nr:flagellar hook-associated protein FlgK [Pseudomonadota bacterium]NOG58927.1 flagellar hook-associated protein FlgK [Pseudomonadota bacterium]